MKVESPQPPTSAMPMRVLIVTPAPPGSTRGNRVSAERWGRMLAELGHLVAIEERYDGRDAELLLALHARRSAAAIDRFAHEHPGRPIVLALTGTDVYGDIRTDSSAQRSLSLATRLIALQPAALDELPPDVRARTRVIWQSVVAPPALPARRDDVFEVAVIGHLREVKDPLRTAAASRLLPAGSRLRVLQIGGALEPGFAAAAEAEQAANPRYEWLGERPRDETLRLLARCRLMSLTSRMEGGANAVSEAIVVGTPVISSRIGGSTGMLGDDYPGYFAVGDTAGLAALLSRAESDAAFLADLAARGERLRERLTPERERDALAALIAECGG